MLVKELREGLGMNRREFSIAIEATDASVGRWENAGFTINHDGIHPMFKKQMEKMSRKLKAEQ